VPGFILRSEFAGPETRQDERERLRQVRPHRGAHKVRELGQSGHLAEQRQDVLGFLLIAFSGGAGKSTTAAIEERFPVHRLSSLSVWSARKLATILGKVRVSMGLDR
jgi:hypothetical protein